MTVAARVSQLSPDHAVRTVASALSAATLLGAAPGAAAAAADVSSIAAGLAAPAHAACTAASALSAATRLDAAPGAAGPVDTVTRWCRMTLLPKLLSLKDQAAAAAASLANFLLDNPFATCGVDALPFKTPLNALYIVLPARALSRFAIGAAVDATRDWSDFSGGESSGREDHDELSGCDGHS